MTSCFEVAMDLADAGYVKPEDVNETTTVLVETLLALGVIKERSRAVEDKAAKEEIYTAAEYAAAADEAMGNFEDELRQAEIMIEAKEHNEKDEAIIKEADEVIDQNVHTATSALVENGLVKSADVDQVVRIIARSWASIDS